jgi:hypothetical protein
VLGKRRGYPTVRHPPHDLTMTASAPASCGSAGFGFNAGSAGANGTAALALINTHLAAAAGALAWTIVEGTRIRKFTMLGVASGLVAGLVAITPAAGYVSPMVAIVIGIAAGLVCYGAVLLKAKLGYDDALDAFGVHGVGGATGALLTGVFARAALNNGDAGGLSLLGKQAIGVAAAGAWAAVVTFVLLKILDLTIGLRVDQRRARRPRWRASWRVGVREPQLDCPSIQVITVIWQFIRKNRLCGSAKTDINLLMRSAAAADIVSLDEYRSRRSTSAPRTQPQQTAPVPTSPPRVWVYWVPVWVW